MTSICIENSNNLLTVDTSWIAGYECKSTALYVILLFITIGLQIASNYIWVANAQATREALHEQIGSKGRCHYTGALLWYTLLSMVIYICNILLILGANLGVLCAVLIGNILGTWLSVTHQSMDRSRTAMLVKTMVAEYDDLVKRQRHVRQLVVGGLRLGVVQSCQGALTEEQQQHLAILEETRTALRNFVSYK